MTEEEFHLYMEESRERGRQDSQPAIYELLDESLKLKTALEMSAIEIDALKSELERLWSEIDYWKGRAFAAEDRLSAFNPIKRDDPQ